MNTQVLFDFAENLAEPVSVGKDEMNFAEFPIALLTDRVPTGQKIIKFEDEVYDERRKRMVPRRRVIEGSEEYGLPTATDDLVILALIQLTKQKGNFARRQIEFTRSELIALLGWNDEGHSYERIKNSLLRIKGVNYFYDNAWWDGRQKTWTTKAFSIIDNVEINDSRTGAGQSGLFPSSITWNQVVFDSFQAGFLRNINYQICIQLKHPTALRMYRFLGKRFYFQPEWSFDLKKFAHEHLALGLKYEGGAAIARKLKPAIAELEAIGFLEPLTEAERFTKKGRDWTIKLVQKRLVLLTHLNVEAPSQEVSESSKLIEALTARGVSAKTASELFTSHPAAAIAAKIEAFDWLKSRKDRRIGRSPAGYLVKSIRDNYSTPEGFVTKAEQDRLEEARRIRTEDESKARSVSWAVKAKADQLEAQAKSYIKTRTPEQLATLEAAALAQVSEETRQDIAQPYMQKHIKTRMLLLVKDHVTQLIETGQLSYEVA